jgi:hypothetical protein
VVDEVILRFINRDYKDEESKWRIGSKGLSVLLILLQHYTPSAEDFEQKTISVNDRRITLTKPPGFELILSLLKEEGVELRQQLIAAASRGLDAMVGEDRVPAIELTVRRVFQIIEIVLAKQTAVLDFNEHSSHPFVLSRLERYLMRSKYVRSSFSLSSY